MAARKPNQPAKLSAFISHAKADAKKAQEIAASLEERGLKCWIAPRDVTAGRTYGDEIIRGIESAKAFVLVLSKGSNGSAFVAREVERAVSKQKPIFVIRLANIEPAPALELFISGTQWIDAFPGKLGPHIGKLAKLLGEDGGIEQAKPEQSDAGTAPGKRPKWALPAGAAAALLLAVGVGFAFWPDRSRVSDADPFLMTKPVWDDKQETQAPQQMAAAQVPDRHWPSSLSSKWSSGTRLSKVPWNGRPDARSGSIHKARRTPISRPARRRRAMRALPPATAPSPRESSAGAICPICITIVVSCACRRASSTEALVDLDEAIGIDASNFFAFWNRGAVYGAKSDFVRAQADFTTGARPESRRNDESEDCRGAERGHGKRQGGRCPVSRSLGDQRSVDFRRRPGRQRLRRIELPGRRHARFSSSGAADGAGLYSIAFRDLSGHSTGS